MINKLLTFILLFLTVALNGQGKGTFLQGDANNGIFYACDTAENKTILVEFIDGKLLCCYDGNISNENKIDCPNYIIGECLQPALNLTESEVCIELTQGNVLSRTTMKKVTYWSEAGEVDSICYFQQDFKFAKAPISFPVKEGNCNNEPVSIYSECWAKRDSIFDYRATLNVTAIPFWIVNVSEGVGYQNNYSMPNNQSEAQRFEDDLNDWLASQGYQGYADVILDGSTIFVDVKDTDSPVTFLQHGSSVSTFIQSNPRWNGGYRNCATVYKGIFKEYNSQTGYVKDTIIVCDEFGNSLNDGLGQEPNYVFDTIGLVRVDCNVCNDNNLPKCEIDWSIENGCMNNDIPIWWKVGLDCNGNIYYEGGLNQDSIIYYKNTNSYNDECYTIEEEAFTIYTGGGTAIGGGGTFASWRGPIYYPPVSSGISNFEYENRIDDINNAIQNGCYVVLTSMQEEYPAVAVVGGAGGNNSFLASIGFSSNPSNTTLSSDHTILGDCPDEEQAIINSHLNGNGAPVATLDTNWIWSVKIICIENSGSLSFEPNNVCVGNCPVDELEIEIPEKGDCKKSSTLWTVIDNTGTTFNSTSIYNVYFTDGTSTTVTQTPQSGWTQQIEHWAEILGDAVAQKCDRYISEPRCNILPNGCGGLDPPPAELQGNIKNMKWRYLQIGACPTCPAINRVELVTVNGTDLAKPKPLVMSFVEGKEIRYTVCQDCGEEPILYYADSTYAPSGATSLIVAESDMPLCLFDCSESLPILPEAGCDIALQEEACDDNGTPTDFSDDIDVTIFYFNCDGVLSKFYYVPDPLDPSALIDYELVGEEIKCGGGEIEEPTFPTDSIAISNLSDIWDGLIDTCCSVGAETYYDVSSTLFQCSKIGFVTDNAFTSICPAGWTCSELADKLNEGNPTGTQFSCNGDGNLIVTSGTPPELIHFFHSGGGSTTVYPEGGDGSCKIGISTIECNSADILSELQEINENLCPSEVTSNVICIDVEQTVNTENGVVTFQPDDEVLIARELDCKGNPQGFGIFFLSGGSIFEIIDPVSTKACANASEPVNLGCIKDNNGEKWNVFETTLNGTNIIYYQTNDGTVGTPSGNSSEWSGCENGDYEIICYKDVQGNIFEGYKDFENKIIYDVNDNIVVGAMQVESYLCDASTCIQYSECFGTNVAGGLQVTEYWINGNAVSIPYSGGYTNWIDDVSSMFGGYGDAFEGQEESNISGCGNFPNISAINFYDLKVTVDSVSFSNGNTVSFLNTCGNKMIKIRTSTCVGNQPYWILDYTDGSSELIANEFPVDNWCICDENNYYLINRYSDWVFGSEDKNTTNGFNNSANNEGCNGATSMEYYGFVTANGNVDVPWTSVTYSPVTSQADMLQVIVDGLNAAATGANFQVNTSGNQPEIRGEFDNTEDYGIIIFERYLIGGVPCEVNGDGWSVGRLSNGTVWDCINSNSNTYPYNSGSCTSGDIEEGNL